VTNRNFFTTTIYFDIRKFLEGVFSSPDQKKFLNLPPTDTMLKLDTMHFYPPLNSCDGILTN
jgi:hypothetical protein